MLSVRPSLKAGEGEGELLATQSAVLRLDVTGDDRAMGLIRSLLRLGWRGLTPVHINGGDHVFGEPYKTRTCLLSIMSGVL